MNEVRPNLSAQPPCARKIPLRALLLEDSPADTALLVGYLEESFQLHYRRVDNAASLVEALSLQSWDVILCDYRMPAFGFAPALELLRDHSLDIPFIVVSGSIGEDLAVNAMKAGAHDYIMKDNLMRLAPAIEREIRQARARHEREHTVQKAAWLAAIVDSVGEAVIGADPSGKILSWNAGAEKLYGFSAEEAIGRNAEFVVPPALRDDARQMLDRIREGGRIDELETVRLRNDGMLIDVATAISAIRNADGSVTGIAILARDITGRKQAEEERKNIIKELNETLAQVRQLRGLLPICASCKKIRDEKGNWQPIERYISGHSGAEFSHSICPSCAHNLYPDFADKMTQ